MQMYLTHTALLGLPSSQSSQNFYYTVHISWTPPPPLWTKCNVDRSIIENIKMAACAGVFWDEFGNWIYGFVRNLGMLSQLNFGASFQPYRLHGIRGFGI